METFRYNVCPAFCLYMISLLLWLPWMVWKSITRQENVTAYHRADVHRSCSCWFINSWHKCSLQAKHDPPPPPQVVLFRSFGLVIQKRFISNFPSGPRPSRLVYHPCPRPCLLVMDDEWWRYISESTRNSSQMLKIYSVCVISWTYLCIVECLSCW